MATRMKALGIKATVVGGRIRDLKELKATGLPVCLDLSWFLSGSMLLIAFFLLDNRYSLVLVLPLAQVPRPRQVLVMCQSQLGVLLFRL